MCVCRYWKYYDNRLEEGPRDIKQYGLPSALQNMDAAFIWEGNKKTYFFKGGNYWRYNENSNSIDANYPRPISVWGKKQSWIHTFTRKVQVRGLEFDSGLWFSFCLIEILSITAQKFSKCLKNGSDLLRKGTTASTSLFVKLPINAMRTFNLWYPWSRIASGQSFKIVAGSSIFSSSLLACSRRSDSRAREKAFPPPPRFPPFSRCTIQLAPHHLTAELYYLKAWNRLLSPNQRGQASMRLSEKGLISLPASHIVHSWEKSRDGLPATVASFPLQTIERTQTSSKNTESLTTITSILVSRVLVKA